MTLYEMNIPAVLKKEAADLIWRIELAEGLIELAAVGGMTDGFVIGIHCLKAIPPSEVDALELIFSRALDMRLVELRR